MSIRISQFNKILLETVTFIHKKFPTDRDIDYAMCQIEMVIPISPRSVVVQFMSSIKSYIPKILARDVSFFIDLLKSDEYLKCFELHDKWHLLSSDEQEYILGNAIKLVKLGTIIIDETQ
jgi:hypothetical protein